MNSIIKKNVKVSEAAFSNEKFEIYVLSHNIFKLKPKAGIELDVVDGYEMRSNFLSLSKGNKFAVLTDATNFFSTTGELRQLLASSAFTELRFAAAIVSQSPANKIIGNFFIKVNKPSTPTKLFSSEKMAFEWLNHLSLSLQ
jgi:hypothetical protein